MDASSANQDSLPISSDVLLERMRDWGVSFELYEHKPLHTVEDAKTVQGSVIPEPPGAVHIKNFFLRDKKKRNYLVVLEQDRAIDLKALGRMIGGSGVSFGSAERLMEHLGVRPGAVSPLAMVNGAGTGVKLFIDAVLQRAEEIYVHPLVNDRTIGLSPGQIEYVMGRFGCEVTWLDF